MEKIPNNSTESKTSVSNNEGSVKNGTTQQPTKEAFEFFPDDAESIFQQLQSKSTTPGIATVESIKSAYNKKRDHKVAAVKDSEKISSAMKKFHEELLGNTDPAKQSTLDEESFVRGIEKANQLLMTQPEYKREEIMKEFERLSLELACEDPKFFMDMLDLPGALLLEDVKALMAQIK
jgi:hypothetical protein